VFDLPSAIPAYLASSRRSRSSKGDGRGGWTGQGRPRGAA
jgi:hypothetical protein